MRLIIYVIIIVNILFIPVLGDDCYDSQKIWLVIRTGSTAGLFETKSAWALDGGTLEELIANKSRWFARNKEGFLIDEAMLDIAGQNDLAQQLSIERQKARSGSTTRLILGLPFGIGLIGGSAYWAMKAWDKETPSTIDLAGSLCLGIAGVGILVGVISSFRKHHGEPDPNEHQILLSQAVDVVDRYNNSLKRKCQSNNSNGTQQGK